MMPTEPVLDFFECLREGKLPAMLKVNGGDYSGIIASDIIPTMLNIPQFGPWFDKMDIFECTAIYCGEAVPTITTSESLSRSEVTALRDSPKLIPSLFQSMCHAMLHQTLPYEEVFAIVVDALHTMNYVHYKTLGTLH
ncbi:TPA: hypothetical protein ACTPQ1_004784 [Salmonella enterica]